MKEPEYREGPEAQEKFEEGMRSPFNVPKDAVVKAEKEQKGKRRDSSRGQSIRKRHVSDKDWNGSVLGQFGYAQPRMTVLANAS